MSQTIHLIGSATFLDGTRRHITATEYMSYSVDLYRAACGDWVEWRDLTDHPVVREHPYYDRQYCAQCITNRRMDKKLFQDLLV